jgi:hypothetical protein
LINEQQDFEETKRMRKEIMPKSLNRLKISKACGKSEISPDIVDQKFIQRKDRNETTKVS